MIRRLSLALSLLLAPRAVPAAPFTAPPAPVLFAALGFPPSLTKPRLQSLLQSFVDDGYGRRFRHLGDERDFDHGHVLLDARTHLPVAILYHTQELAHEATTGDFGYIDASGRNWIQWLDGRGIENANRYERAKYPSTATWDWFVARELPKLRRRHTITDKMLDPERLGLEFAPGLQWTFTHIPCGQENDDRLGVIRVSLPLATPVCLALGAS